MSNLYLLPGGQEQLPSPWMLSQNIWLKCLKNNNKLESKFFHLGLHPIQLKIFTYARVQNHSMAIWLSDHFGHNIWSLWRLGHKKYALVVFVFGGCLHRVSFQLRSSPPTPGFQKQPNISDWLLWSWLSTWNMMRVWSKSFSTSHLRWSPTQWVRGRTVKTSSG